MQTPDFAGKLYLHMCSSANRLSCIDMSMSLCYAMGTCCMLLFLMACQFDHTLSTSTDVCAQDLRQDAQSSQQPALGKQHQLSEDAQYIKDAMNKCTRWLSSTDDRTIFAQVAPSPLAPSSKMAPSSKRQSGTSQEVDPISNESTTANSAVRHSLNNEDAEGLDSKHFETAAPSSIPQGNRPRPTLQKEKVACAPETVPASAEAQQATAHSPNAKQLSSEIHPLRDSSGGSRVQNASKQGSSRKKTTIHSTECTNVQHNTATSTADGQSLLHHGCVLFSTSTSLDLLDTRLFLSLSWCTSAALSPLIDMLAAAEAHRRPATACTALLHCCRLQP